MKKGRRKEERRRKERDTLTPILPHKKLQNKK
jgi:hypothetical protein